MVVSVSQTAIALVLDLEILDYVSPSKVFDRESKGNHNI